ncbi:hypothetical protein KDX40_24680 [Burkholderia ambifaria]|nr:hypothetical protein [Burkholderia ambifaria]
MNTRNMHTKRECLKDHQICVIGDGPFTCTGEEQRQDDESVWLQLIQLAKSLPLREGVRFRADTRTRARWPAPSVRPMGCRQSPFTPALGKRQERPSLPRYFAAISDGVQRARHRLESAEEVAYTVPG